MIDRKRVVSRSAIDRHRRADAVRQEASRCFDCCELIRDRDVGEVVSPLRAEDLPDLKRVISIIAVEHDFGGRVVGNERVVAEAAVDGDSLDSDVVNHFGIEAVVEQRDERTPAIGTRSQ